MLPQALFLCKIFLITHQIYARFHIGTDHMKKVYQPSGLV